QPAPAPPPPRPRTCRPSPAAGPPRTGAVCGAQHPYFYSEPDPVLGIDIAAVRVIRRVARVDQSATGLVGRLVRIVIKHVVHAHAQEMARSDRIADGQIE